MDTVLDWLEYHEPIWDLMTAVGTRGSRSRLRGLPPGIGSKRFPTEVYRIAKDGSRLDAILVRSHDMNAMKIPDSARDRSRRRGHEQHSGDAMSERACGCQRIGRERGKGIGSRSLLFNQEPWPRHASNRSS
jgi:hypothetical protein